MTELTSTHRKLITIVLLALAIWDLALWAVTFFFPDFWISQVHGQSMADPMGLLQRTGAMWLAFAIFQFIAFLAWQKAPFWLCLVAGMRLSELVADWAYLGFADASTTTARITLSVMPVLNIAISLVFLWAYRRASGGAGFGRA